MTEKTTRWFKWPVRPVREGWYDFRGFLWDARTYWNGKQWGYWMGSQWIHLADCASDEWRGLAHPPRDARSAQE